MAASLRNLFGALRANRPEMNPQDKQPRSSNLRKQLLLAISPFLVAVTLLVLLAFETTNTLSEVRAYVQGESLWTSAQKEAARRLEIYAQSGSDADFAAYQREIDVTLGDRRARRELKKVQPDLDVVREGFLAGRNHADDIAGMIQLYQRFHNVSFLQKAVSLWSEGDRQIDEIMAAGDALHVSFASASGSPDERAAQRADALARLRAADARATPLEMAFSATLGDASRQLHTMLQIGALVLAAVLAAVKFLFSWWMLRQHARIERALRASEERFDLAVRGSNDGIWNWVPEEEDVYLSPRAVELLGYPFHDVPRKPLDMLPLVHWEDRETVRSAISALFSANQALDVEFRSLDWGGNYRWVHVRGSAVRIEGEHIRRVAGSITDIGYRKRSEALIRNLAIDEQRRAEQAQIALLEQVQGRIGRELHDDLGQRLTGVAFLVKALEQRLGASTPREAEQAAWIVKLINEAIDRVRFLSRQLSPIEIDEITLAMALRRLVDDIHSIFGTRIALRISDGDMPIPSEDSNQFFRIAQESISNALRHGHATQIVVRLDVFAHGTRLAVSDNGEGFVVSDSGSFGLGLRNMAIRARSLRGCLRVRSTKRGTTVIVRAGGGARVNQKAAVEAAEAL
jgi:PAS domain S-box-containing protein